MAPLFAAACDADYSWVVEAVQQGGKCMDVPADHPGLEFKEVWCELAIIDEEADPLLVVAAVAGSSPQEDQVRISGRPSPSPRTAPGTRYCT